MKKHQSLRLIIALFFGLFFLSIFQIKAHAESILYSQVYYEYDASRGGYVATGTPETNRYISILDKVNGEPVVAIDDYAFAFHPNLRSVLLNNQFIDIGEGAFMGCSSLESINPPFINTIRRYTFYGCSSLTSFRFSYQTKYIEESAFENSGLTDVFLTDEVVSIGENAFQAPNLEKAKFEGSPSYIANSAFDPAKTIINAASTSTAASWAMRNHSTIIYTDHPDISGGSSSSGTSNTNTGSGNSTPNTPVVTGPLTIKRAGHATVFAGEYTPGFIITNNKTKAVFKSSKPSVVTVSSTGAVSFKKAGKATVKVTVDGKTFSYKYTVLKRTQANVLKVVYKYYVTKKMSTRNKVIAADSFIAANVTYDMRYFKGKKIPARSHTAKGAFEKGVAVCDGYTKAFNTIMSHYKIPCKKIVGKAKSFGSWGSHAWSKVKVGGKWYYVDTTWNDPIYEAYYSSRHTKHYSSQLYLLVSASYLRKDHAWK
ncbi:MAG: leucine-rich repeat protein [Eubacteriales bacterium]|nr:leucine-rich repeat protein [Eubacteriales bacterium]